MNVAWILICNLIYSGFALATCCGESPDAKDFYRRLGITSDASPEVIKKQYRRLMKHYHPDRPGGDLEISKKIIEAGEVLTDQGRRANYNKRGANSGERSYYSSNPWASKTLDLLKKSRKETPSWSFVEQYFTNEYQYKAVEILIKMDLQVSDKLGHLASLGNEVQFRIFQAVANYSDGDQLDKVLPHLSQVTTDYPYRALMMMIEHNKKSLVAFKWIATFRAKESVELVRLLLKHKSSVAGFLRDIDPNSARHEYLEAFDLLLGTAAPIAIHDSKSKRLSREMRLRSVLNSGDLANLSGALSDFLTDDGVADEIAGLAKRVYKLIREIKAGEVDLKSIVSVSEYRKLRPNASAESYLLQVLAQLPDKAHLSDLVFFQVGDADSFQWLAGGLFSSSANIDDLSHFQKLIDLARKQSPKIPSSVYEIPGIQEELLRLAREDQSPRTALKILALVKQRRSSRDEFKGFKDQLLAVIQGNLLAGIYEQSDAKVAIEACLGQGSSDCRVAIGEYLLHSDAKDFDQGTILVASEVGSIELKTGLLLLALKKTDSDIEWNGLIEAWSQLEQGDFARVWEESRAELLSGSQSAKLDRELYLKLLRAGIKDRDFVREGGLKVASTLEPEEQVHFYVRATAVAANSVLQSEILHLAYLGSSSNIDSLNALIISFKGNVAAQSDLVAWYLRDREYLLDAEDFSRLEIPRNPSASLTSELVKLRSVRPWLFSSGFKRIVSLCGYYAGGAYPK